MKPTDEELKELRGAAEDAQGPFKSGFMAQCASETLHDMLGAETILGLLELLDEAKAESEARRLRAEANAEMYRAERALAESLKVDAERYRCLRAQHWYKSRLFVVSGTKEAIRPGTDCPSDGRLDAMVDSLRSPGRDYIASAPKDGTEIWVEHGEGWLLAQWDADALCWTHQGAAIRDQPKTWLSMPGQKVPQ